MKKRLIFTAVALLLASAGFWYVAVYSQKDNNPADTVKPVVIDDTPNKTINEVIASNKRFSKFGKMILDSGVGQELESADIKTIFVPTDEAFSSLGEPTASLINDLEPSLKKSIVLYHVAKGEVLADALQPAQKVPTLNPQEFVVEVDGEYIYIVSAKGDRAKIITRDIKTLNGVIHVIDNLMLPQ